MWLALGAMVSIALGLTISAALIQVPSYTRGRVVIHMPITSVMSMHGGAVVERLVVPDQRVAVGAPLLRLKAKREPQELVTIYAPIEGVVRSITDADRVDEGQFVAEVIPEGSAPMAMAFMPSADSKRIEVGMTLEMSITGYDRIRVAVTEVLPSESFVRIKARLHTTRFESAGMTYELHDGQAGLAYIQIGSSSLLSVVLGGDATR